MDFSRKLLQIRVSKNLSQAEMARELGLKSQQVYSNLEKGVTKRVPQEIIVYIEKNYRDEMQHSLSEPGAQYATSKKAVVENPADFLTHKMLEMEAYMRIILRSQAEIMAEKRRESVTKVLSELSRAVKDELSTSVSELKQGK